VIKYADRLVEWLVELGYTDCFFVAGGNIMHLLDACRLRMRCTAYIHEVAAALAAESFNELRSTGQGRAFVLVTAGPGLTNAVTAIAQSWLESRELLVIGGQVKSSDLATDGLRQRGIQEIDGVSIAKPCCVVAERIVAPTNRATIATWVERGRGGRKGPVFLEICLDAQGAPVEADFGEGVSTPDESPQGHPSPVTAAAAATAATWSRDARRPVLLLGGGVSRGAALRLRERLVSASIAVMTTWNAMDRMDSADPNYFGRPNTWGQRSSNVLIQQADLVIAVGTRLGLQQTGFNWQGFAPLARIVHVDIDPAELAKGHPRTDLPVAGDADQFLSDLFMHDLGDHDDWIRFGREVRALLPLAEPANTHAAGFVDPYVFTMQLGELATSRDILIPCSSGASFTVPMQCFPQKSGQLISTAKGLASMGVGLSSAIGAAFAGEGRRTILFEGDGGFSQNLQELATVRVNDLPLKIFLMSNEGYASIRMTQRNYFGGAYLGCDVQTGLGFPHWERLFEAYGIPCLTLDASGVGTARFTDLFDAAGPAAFVVPIDPEQSYFPKISSRVTQSGGMESNPLHLMTPELPAELALRVMPHFHSVV
jgi:acetolactate synthase-1/2/3 large subunit